MFKWYEEHKDGWVGTVVNIVGGFVIALIIYNLLIFGLGTQTPLVSVFSGSMEHDYFDAQTGYHDGILGVSLDNYWISYGKWYEEHGVEKEEFKEWPISGGFKKGDMLVVTGFGELEQGDIIVFDSGKFNYPIIHRIVNVTEEGYETKGDHNSGKDSWIVKKENIYGKAGFVIPLVGWVKVIFSELTGFV